VTGAYAIAASFAAGQDMRVRNMRFVVTGTVLVLGAIAFFLYFMLAMAARSNDPVAMMRTVGQVSGVVGFIGAAMAVVGLVGRKA
jgi:hypothetical protein